MSYSPIFFSPQSTGSSQNIVTSYYNNTGLAIAQGTPVSVNPSDGSIVLTDVTNEASVEAFVGFANVRIPTGTTGPVISMGRLLNIMTSFSVGDPIWIGIGGVLTNVKPNAGSGGFSSGDLVYFCGVLVENQTNPSLTDIQLFPQLIGQL